MNNKTMRELVIAELADRHRWRNETTYYDDPKVLPDLESMSDEEVWHLFLQFAGGVAVG